MTTLLRSHLEGMRIDETGPSRNIINFALLTQMMEAPRHFLDNTLLPGLNFLEIDLGGAEFEAPFFGLPAFSDDLGDVQKGLGGDAALMEAGAAQTSFGTDKTDLKAQVGGPKGGGVTSWTRTDHDNF